MTASAPSAAPLSAWRRHVGIAVAVCVLAWLAALPAHDGAAQDHSSSPSPQRLWKAYPLEPTAEPGTQPKEASSPAASTGTSTSRRTVSTASASSDGGGGAPVFILVLAALAAAGGMLTFVSVRRRRESEPASAAGEPARSSAAAGARPVPALWHGPTGRFSRAVTKTPVTATLVATRGADDAGPPAAPDPPRRDGPTPVDAPAPAPAGSPPEPGLSWAAEIEWREVDGESRFCVIARGAGTVEIAQSPPLDWPPEGPAAVQAVTDAADALAATLVAAGWKPLPPGSAWYAKRFAWEPAPAEAAKGPRLESIGGQPVAPPRPEGRAPASGESGAPDRGRRRRARAKLLALLGILAVFAVIAVQQLGDGTRSGGSAPMEGIDLSVPLLALVGLVLLVLAIAQFRSTLRRTTPRETKETRSRR